MTADFPVLLDACVLANQRVTDLLLRLAETPRLFLPYPKKENGRVYLAPFYEALHGEVELANPGQFSPAEQ